MLIVDGMQHMENSRTFIDSDKVILEMRVGIAGWIKPEYLDGDLSHVTALVSIPSRDSER